ncbi:MAG: caspase family protein [Planctomycetes bacterium]|nr:caspase family protein [Planctomycetota bacterium]
MSRVAFALLLAALTALVTSQVEVAVAVGQDKKKDKKKDKGGAPAGDIKDDLARVLPVFDPGSHTQPISAMGFTKDKSKLVTVGQDFTVRVWNVATGERLDILRLPGYGREKGYDPGRWDIAAVSPDGTRVLIGGQPKFIRGEFGKPNGISRLLLVDLPSRRVMQVGLQGNQGNGYVEALAFSPDGERFAVAFNKAGGDRLNLYVVGGLTDRITAATEELKSHDCAYVKTPFADKGSCIAFSPDGKQLLVGSSDLRVSIWDVPAGIAPVSTMAKEIPVEGTTHSVAWSPDGKQFARTGDGTGKSDLRAIELWNVDGTKSKTWRASELNNVFTARAGKIYTVTFLNANTLYFVANGPAEKKDGGASLAGTIDIATGKDTRIATDADGMLKIPLGGACADGSLVGFTVTGNTEVLVGRPVPGAPRIRCGIENQLPYHVGWSKDAVKAGFAWTDERHSGKETPTADVLRFGFDLSKVEPVGEIKGEDYIPSLRKLGDWTLEFPGKKGDNDDAKGLAQLKQGGKFVHGFPGAKGIGHTLIPNGDKPPHVANADRIDGQGDRAGIQTAEGAFISRLLPQTTRIHSMASSPDGRFLICTTGTPRLVVYRTDGSPYPLFSFAQLNGEWVLWTPEGYYAASPGGEKMFGWVINNGPNALVTFHPAEKFAKQFRRPDVIKLAIEKGSVAEALVSLSTVVPELEKILPPSSKLEVVEQRGTTVKVKASASTGVKDKPVTAMRVLLDGRPLPAGKGVWMPGAGKSAEDVFEFEVPAGLHELKVLARSEDGSTVSDPLIVRGPKVAGSQPTIYRVCIGVNDYDDAGLKLSSAAKDAEAMFAALEKHCVGSDNRFGTAKGEMILNKDVTRERVLKALDDARKAAKPGDLVVIFFAGHGVKQGDSYYLLTREADVTKDLKGKSLSGDDLRKGLAEVECPVLLILDACHSAAGVKAFRPATDDLTRSLTDDAVGVTVMSAAMSHETAGATAENGFFTAGLLKGLKAGDGVPFDPYEKQLYVHHLYSVAFSEVRKATGGKQNPFLNMPWTVPPLPVREVPGK